MLAQYMLSSYVSLRPSVRPSHAGIVHKITQTTPYDSSGTLLFFSDAKISAKFQRGNSEMDAK